MILYIIAGPLKYGFNLFRGLLYIYDSETANAFFTIEFMISYLCFNKYTVGKMLS